MKLIPSLAYSKMAQQVSYGDTVEELSLLAIAISTYCLSVSLKVLGMARKWNHLKSYSVHVANLNLWPSTFLFPLHSPRLETVLCWGSHKRALSPVSDCGLSVYALWWVVFSRVVFEPGQHAVLLQSSVGEIPEW